LEFVADWLQIYYVDRFVFRTFVCVYSLLASCTTMILIMIKIGRGQVVVVVWSGGGEGGGRSVGCVFVLEFPSENGCLILKGVCVQSRACVPE